MVRFSWPAILCGLLLAFPLFAPSAHASPGDVNNDGKLDIADVVTVLQASVGLATLSPDQTLTADVAPRPGANQRLYGDGQITTLDVVRLLRADIGLILPSELTPQEPRLLYTLNAGSQCKGPGTASKVDLQKWLTAPQDAVTLNAFGTGGTPSYMFRSGDTGYVANSEDGTLQVMDLNADTSTGTIDLGTGSFPQQVTLAGGKAFVTLLTTNKVAVADLATQTVTDQIDTGTGPTGAVTANGKVYISNTAFLGYDPEAMVSKYGQGTVTVLDPATDAILKTINVPTNPQDMALDPQGRIHVVSTGNYADQTGVVTVIDPVSDSIVGSVPIGGAPGAVAITFQGKAYLSDSIFGITSYDALSLKVLREPKDAIPVSPYPWDLATDSRGRLFVEVLSADKVLVFDSSTDEKVGEIPVGSCPEALMVE